MKKLILSLLCIGSILALPGCWCCRRTCEEPCGNYCDDYDDCYDACEADGRDIVGYEEQQGYRKPIYRKGTSPDRQAGYEVQQGHKMPLASKKGGRNARPMMHEPVDPNIMRRAAEQGKVAEYCNPEHARQGKRMYKESMRSEAPRARNEAKEMMDMDMK